MNVSVSKLILCVLGSAALSACGSPGVPLPPSLELPRPVTNLRASRKGDRVTLTWIVPTKTTDQHNIRHGGATLICRDLTAMKECVTPVGQVPFQRPSTAKTQTAPAETYADQLPPALEPQNPLGSVHYAVSVENSYHRSAGLSNQVQVPAAPTLAPPSNFQAHLGAGGVRLNWNAVDNPPDISGLRFCYRVYRRDVVTKKDAVAGELPVVNQPSPEILDPNFEWEETYEYRITVVTFITQPSGGEQQVEGDDTPPVTVFAHDVFPPATPTGLQAVFSGPGQKPFIDLVWSPNAEPDLAGYNVYRHEEGTAPVKISSELIKSPAFRDTNVFPGHSYSYSVSAVDVRGNESPHSEEASETVPAQ